MILIFQTWYWYDIDIGHFTKTWYWYDIDISNLILIWYWYFQPDIDMIFDIRKKTWYLILIFWYSFIFCFYASFWSIRVTIFIISTCFCIFCVLVVVFGPWKLSFSPCFCFFNRNIVFTLLDRQRTRFSISYGLTDDDSTTILLILTPYNTWNRWFDIWMDMGSRSVPVLLWTCQSLSNSFV